MRDQDARDRIATLENGFETLPERITEAVLAAIQPQHDALNERLDALTARLGVLEAALKDQADHELLEVIETELNALRVDVNAGREASAELGASIAHTDARVTRIVEAFGRVASSG